MNIENEYPILYLTEINWDTDGETIDLPTELRIVWEDTEWSEDEISDWVCNEYGWLVNGFCVEVK